MKKMYILIALVFFSYDVSSQGCYNEISKFSGVENNNLQELSDIACLLRESMPKRFENDFAVYSFEFYSISEYFEGSYPKQFAKVIDYVETKSDYYLIIGKENSAKGLISNSYIKVKLPTSDSLDCLDESMMDYISTIVSHKIKNKFNDLDNVYPFYYKAEIEGMKFLTTYVLDKIGCCQSPLRDGYCGVCLDEADLNTYLTEDKKFNVCSSYSIDAIPKIDTLSSLKEYAEITLSDGTNTFSLNSKIKQIITDFSEYCPNSGGEIQYYFNDNSCLDILDLASTELAIDKSKNYFYIKVVAYESEIIGENLAIKIETNLNKSNGKGTGTLYFINLDSNFDVDAIIDSTKAFFNLADLNINTMKIVKNRKFSMGESDGVAVIAGNKDGVVRYIFNTENICDLLDENSTIGFSDWCDIDNSMKPETTRNPAIGVSTSDLSTFYTNYENVEKTNRLENNPSRLIAFIILHGTSHLAGLVHPDAAGNIEPGKSEGHGYASDGDKISEYIKEYIPKMNFEEIIIWTKESFPSVINLTNARFNK